MSVNGDPLGGCDHPGCVSSDVEQHARDACATVLGDAQLVRVCEQTSAGPIPDFQSPRHTVEVKALTSPAPARKCAARGFCRRRTRGLARRRRTPPRSGLTL